MTDDPAYEPLATMPDSDYTSEGWEWLYAHPEAIRWPGVAQSDFSWEAFERWRARPGSVWVVRFRLVALAAEVATFPVGTICAEH
jgi:hypothetical protein